MKMNSKMYLPSFEIDVERILAGVKRNPSDEALFVASVYPVPVLGFTWLRSQEAVLFSLN